MKLALTKLSYSASHCIALAVATIIVGLASQSLAQPAGSHKAQQPQTEQPGFAAAPAVDPAEPEGYVSGQSICWGRANLHHRMPCYNVD
jgi:hypothetical protein